MKKLATIFFIGIYMMTFMECHQFLKIPFLVQHFQKHHEANPSMSFGKFIQIHYLSAAIITDDLQQDEQLPFRSVECNATNNTCYIYEPVSLHIAPPQAISKTFYNYNEINNAQLSAFDIFQPPRHC